MSQSPMTNNRAGLAKAGGIMSIVAGAIIFVSAVFGTYLLWALIEAFTLGSSTVPFWLITAFTVPMALMGILAVWGGIMALRLRKWGLALAGSICAVVWFFLLGIPALVLIIMSRHEFT
jgi:hypothetical protein